MIASEDSVFGRITAIRYPASLIGFTISAALRREIHKSVPIHKGGTRAWQSTCKFTCNAPKRRAQFQRKGRTMKKLLTICATFGALSGLGMADSWSGTLLDAPCANRNSNKACEAKRSTGKFLLDVNGTTYRLDYKTNQNVHSAMLETKGITKREPVTANMTGRLRSNGKIDADTIAVQ